MKDKKKIIIIVIVISLVIILFNAIIFNIRKNEHIISTDEVLSVGNYEIKVEDYYEADYDIIDELNYSFDKYLAVDLNIKNIGNKKDVFKAFGYFRMNDGNYKLKQVNLDEYKKKFGKELYPDESFKITLTFPVDNASKYILYYNKTLKEEDERKYGFELSGVNLEKKEVEKTLEHFDISSIGENNEKV